jgi:hypothetical protein
MKLADRMAAFEANIRENEKRGVDSCPLLVFSRSQARRNSTSQKQPETINTPQQERRHTPATVSQSKVPTNKTTGSNLPVVPDAKCQFHYVPKQKQQKSAAATTTPQAANPRGTSVPAIALSSGISPAAPVEQLEDNIICSQSLESQTTTNTHTAPGEEAAVEVMTYRGMQRLLEQQHQKHGKKQTRRATVSGTVAVSETKVQVIKHPKVAAIQPFSECAAVLVESTVSKQPLASSDDSSITKSSSDNDDDSNSVSVDDLEHVDWSDHYKKLIMAEHETNDPTTILLRTQESKSTCSTDNKVPTAVQYHCKNDDPTEETQDMTEVSWMMDTVNNSSWQQASSVVDFDLFGGGATIMATDMQNPTYEQQVRAARERARKREAKVMQTGTGTTKITTGVSIKERMAAFSRATY